MKDLFQESIVTFIDSLTTDEQIEKFYQKYRDENFIFPMESRILTGLYQSITIKQGYLIEEMLRTLLQYDIGNNVHSLSGQMRTVIVYNVDSQKTIQSYIRSHSLRKYDIRTMNKDDQDILESEFLQLLEEIQQNEAQTLTIDVKTKNVNYDIVFYSLIHDTIYLIEIKFCDNHVTPYKEGIVSKLLYNYAGSLNIFRDKRTWKKIQPILYYFNDYKLSSNKWLPETYIWRGKDLFNTCIISYSYEDFLHCIEQVKQSQDMKDVTLKLQSRVHEYLYQKKYV